MRGTINWSYELWMRICTCRHTAASATPSDTIAELHTCAFETHFENNNDQQCCRWSIEFMCLFIPIMNRASCISWMKNDSNESNTLNSTKCRLNYFYFSARIETGCQLTECYQFRELWLSHPRIVKQKIENSSYRRFKLPPVRLFSVRTLRTSLFRLFDNELARDDLPRKKNTNTWANEWMEDESPANRLRSK